MRLVLFSNDSELLTSSLINGIKIIIHEQDEPVFPENQGRFVSAGSHVLINMKYVGLTFIFPIKSALF